MTKQKAHTLVALAIAGGDLVRKPCEVCGATKKVHAHHDDYDKPLDVRWLCPSHHHEAHGKTARPHKPRKRYEGYNPEKTILVRPAPTSAVDKLYPRRKKWPKWWVNRLNLQDVEKST